MTATIIYVLRAIDKKSGFDFSLGAFRSKEAAQLHLSIQNEVTGDKYEHYIDTENLFE